VGTAAGDSPLDPSQRNSGSIDVTIPSEAFMTSSPFAAAHPWQSSTVGHHMVEKT
jgi:hypothetical protein